MGISIDWLMMISAICIISGIIISLTQNERTKKELDILKQQYQHDITMLKDDYNNKIVLLEQKFQKYIDTQNK
ncbi:MAG: hypothetical protein FWF37_01120 [Chloroflexi bacterium]|nr:hypothetical protein [Chloroflexota bacterium]